MKQLNKMHFVRVHKAHHRSSPFIWVYKCRYHCCTAGYHRSFPFTWTERSGCRCCTAGWKSVMTPRLQQWQAVNIHDARLLTGIGVFTLPGFALGPAPNERFFAGAGCVRWTVSLALGVLELVVEGFYTKWNIKLPWIIEELTVTSTADLGWWRSEVLIGAEVFCECFAGTGCVPLAVLLALVVLESVEDFYIK